MTKSIICNDKVCWVCGTIYNLHLHHTLYGVRNRKKADQDGLVVWLCGKHHNQSNDGVHFNKELDTRLKEISEQAWLDHYGKTVEDFIKRYGKNYI